MECQAGMTFGVHPPVQSMQAARFHAPGNGPIVQSKRVEL